jgi:two-component system sensor histidine kinase KdpD
VTRYARVMQGEAERLARMVEDLLDLSRLEQGQAPVLRRASVDPATALHQATTIFERPGVAHRIEVDAPADLPAIDADPDALDRIVKNLVGNAIKYSPPPGPVRVIARAAAEMVEIVVADRGPGIPVDAQARVFEPYFRVADDAQAVRGTGLGLAVVRALVEAHGGAVRVESARGIGTRMCFTIPSVS